MNQTLASTNTPNAYKRALNIGRFDFVASSLWGFHVMFFFLIPHRPALKRAIVLLGTVSMTIGLPACTTADQSTAFFSPYRPDIVQGNFISSERFAQLRPGMTKQEVKHLLGTPLVMSLFHSNRWDYVFTMNSQKGSSHAQHITLVFSGDVLKQIEGGENLLSEAEFIGKVASPVPPQLRSLVMPISDEDTIPPRPQASEALSTPAVSSTPVSSEMNYPPLE
jgi:outer membrane protein assembly factor BamE